jgi:hypothetical protein
VQRQPKSVCNRDKLIENVLIDAMSSEVQKSLKRNRQMSRNIDMQIAGDSSNMFASNQLIRKPRVDKFLVSLFDVFDSFDPRLKLMNEASGIEKL